MKHFLLALTVVLLALPVHAQSTLYSNSTGVGVGTTSPVAGSGLTIAPSAASSGTASLLTITGPADTTLAASTEANDVNFNLARTVQFATGALTNQRAVYLQAPTYAFVGASTLTNAATLDISGPPVAGTYATITNASALVVESGNTGLGTKAPQSTLDVAGGISVGSYAGSNAAPPDGMIISGEVGIGTTSPIYPLDLGNGTAITIMRLNGSSSGSDGGDLILMSLNGTETYYIGNASAVYGGAFSNTFVIHNGAGSPIALMNGSVGIGTTSPNAPLDINGNSLIIETSYTPADNETCTAGTMWWDASYIYVCTSSGTVKRAALSTF